MYKYTLKISCEILNIGNFTYNSVATEELLFQLYHFLDYLDENEYTTRIHNMSYTLRMVLNEIF
jgi:hypothetical protein